MANFGTLEYVLDKFSGTWSWKITGERAVAMVSRIMPQAWYGDGEFEAIVPDDPKNIRQIKWILDRYPLEILSKNVWQKKLPPSAKQVSKKPKRTEKLNLANPGKQFKGNLFNFQREGLDFLIKSSGNALLADEMGLGKCIIGTSLIETENGPVEIATLWKDSSVIEKSDEEEWAKLLHPINVWTFDGQKLIMQRVDSIFRQKIKEQIVKVTLSDGSVIECTKRHKFLTPNGWKAAGHLDMNDVVATPKKQHGDNVEGIQSRSAMSAGLSSDLTNPPSKYVQSTNKEVCLLLDKADTNNHSGLVDQFQKLDSNAIQWCHVEKLELHNHAGYVYDLSVPITHNYVANGIVTHNTIQSLAYLSTEKDAFPVLIIAPLVTLQNWQREIEKFLKRKSRNGRLLENEPPTTTIIRVGKSEDLGKFDFYIINYELLYKRYKDLAKINLKTIICDEVQHLRSKTTQKYHAVKKLSALSSVKYRIGLSGTPIYNRGSEIWPIVDILRPGLLGNFKEFCEYFCYINEKGKAIVLENKRESLRHMLQKHVMLRRKKSDVLTELKEKVRYKEIIDTDINYYNTELEKIWKKLEEERKEAQTAFDASTAYQRAIQSERQAAGIAKLPHVINFVKNIMEIEESVVVFCHHKSIHSLLHQSLSEFKPASIIGGQSDKERQQQIDSFQNGETKLLIAGLRAGNVGINLTRAHYVIFAELDWSPAIHLQAEDRCIKQGQLVNVLNKGLVEIEKVQLNDMVLTHLGNWKKVEKIMKREHRGLMTEITYYGYDNPLTCTHDHKILVLKQNQTKPKWINAHDVSPGDFVLMPIPTRVIDKTFIDIPKECFQNPSQINQFGVVSTNGRYIQIQRRTELDHDLLYLFGWYVAEGFSSTDGAKGRFISLSGHIKEKPILEKLGERLRKFGVAYSIDCKENKAELRAYSIELAKWFSQWFGRTTREKRIPEFILDLPAQKLKTFFDAYCKGDSYFRQNQQEWVTSKQLASQINLIALKCGFVPTIREIDTAKNQGRLVGGYTIPANPNNKNLVMRDDEFCYYPVKKVTTYYDKTIVYDLTVEDDHSFVVGQAIVHNCHRIGQKNTVFAYYLIGNGTLDEHVARVLVDKSYEIDSIMDSKAESFENKEKAKLILAQIQDKIRSITKN